MAEEVAEEKVGQKIKRLWPDCLLICFCPDTTTPPIQRVAVCNIIPLSAENSRDGRKCGILMNADCFQCVDTSYSISATMVAEFVAQGPPCTDVGNLGLYTTAQKLPLTLD